MKKYKPGQRVFVLDDKTLFKGRISRSKEYERNGIYLIVDLRIYDDKENIFGVYDYGHYFYPNDIASFSDKKDFNTLINRYLDILMDKANNILLSINSLHKAKFDVIKEFSNAKFLYAYNEKKEK